MEENSRKENLILSIEIGDIIKRKEEDTEYIVYCKENGLIYLAEINTRKMNFIIRQNKDILEDLIDEKIQKTRPDQKIVDYEILTEKEKIKYDRNLDIVNSLEKEYGPTYMDLTTRKNKPVINKLTEKYQIDRKTILNVMTKYIQSGCSKASLLDMHRERKKYNYKKKTGRKPGKNRPSGKILNEEDYRNFDEAIEKYKKSRQSSYKKVFNEMIMKKYSKYDDIQEAIVLCDDEELPTFKQFTNYAAKIVTPDVRKRVKTSEREFRNNDRPLLSDSLHNVSHPGELFEIDENEMDIEIVSEANHSIVIGRPILYAMVDTYTRMVVAFSVSFENNSRKGLVNCLRNLGIDKAEMCQEYGIRLKDPSLWPYGIIPERVLNDRGAEYTSYEAKRIFKELNITQETLPPGLPSFKGNVEKFFDVVRNEFSDIVENKGLITKRHDSTHKQDACMTLYDVTRIIMICIIHHNGKLMENYPATKDMIDNNVIYTPSKIWEYGVKKYGEPRKITNWNTYRYSLLFPAEKARLSNKGIRYKGLCYTPDDSDGKTWQQIYQIGRKTIKFECRYNPAYVDNLYYASGDKLMVARINKAMKGNADFAGMSWDEYNAYKDYEKSLSDEQYRAQLAKDVEERKSLTEIADSVTPEKAKDFKNITTNRRNERRVNEKMNSIMADVEESPLDNIIENDETLMSSESEEQNDVPTILKEGESPFDTDLQKELMKKLY